MYFRCYNNHCPEHLDAPCELSYEEMEKRFTMSTPCPVGENDCFLECEEGNEFFLLIVGSRSFSDYELLKKKVDYLLSNIEKKHMDIIIVSGGANGTDKLAERYAREKFYRFLEFPADWSKGKSAGYERNEKMHKFIKTAAEQHDGKRGVIAFWDGESKGTAQSFGLAEKYGNSIKVIKI